MKYIENMENYEEIPIKKEYDLNRNGEPVKNVKEMVFGKVVSVDKKFSKSTRSETKYFVLTYGNQIYDPMGASSTREDFIETKLKMVSQDTFNYYSIYLQTKNSIYLTKANRRFLNE